ncbi:MAG: PaaI family thioesterase [Desulfobacteraceae bacterium]|jgi:acyl-coenzyme A thioesterase PaaI-like protein|nr:PaaI family thioesterase [Desulfobacteraceae bacterium]
MDGAFQDGIQDNYCFGCGSDNPHGLHVKSMWLTETDAVCRFQPQPHHAAGPRQYVNGGIIATVIDCHSVCTAIADAYRREGRQIGGGEKIWYVTARLDIHYRKPAPIDEELTLLARVEGVDGKKTRVSCTLSSKDALCAEARVTAVRVAPEWLEPRTVTEAVDP